jgi:hypothetical protein
MAARRDDANEDSFEKVTRVRTYSIHVT